MATATLVTAPTELVVIDAANAAAAVPALANTATEEVAVKNDPASKPVLPIMAAAAVPALESALMAALEV